MMRCEYDHKKLADNVAKHLTWFDEAANFDWETAVVTIDDRHPYTETRFRAKGLIGQRLYVLVFCLRETKVRLISLRKANHREVKRYARDH